MTELIYLTDSYKKNLKTKIVSVTRKGSLWEIVLEKTIFYPQGGGQPSDKGTIVSKAGTAHVKHVRMRDDIVIHECTIEGTLKSGDSVGCTIDWNLRYHNMRVHSAGHIVHEAVMATTQGLTPKKGEHGSDAYIEYAGSLPIDARHRIEREANAIVQKNLSLTTEFVTREELEKRSSYVPEHLPRNKPLRILTIAGYQPIPDGGTQVAKTSEVGPITITDIQNSDTTVQVHYHIEANNLPESSEQTQDSAQLIGLLIEVQNRTIEQIATTEATGEMLHLTYLGAKSEFAKTSHLIKNIPSSGRQQVGIVVNEVKRAIEEAINTKTPTADKNQIDQQALDVTMPGHQPLQGHLHPTTIVIDEMNDIFTSMGFSVYDGPEIESDEYNYNRVNLPMDHPARDLQDSLYIEEPNWLLRTHTSSVESHLLEDVKPPFRFVIPGKVYRYENANATNNIMFYQYEGMAVSTDITMADLKGTLDVFVRKFFGETRETRFRCKYYPQVEPGVGVDISCAFCNKKGCTVCKGRGWIEMLGAGMVHPNMFRMAGLDPNTYSGFAWGMGLDRIVMQRYGIADIRSLYNGDIGYKE